MSLRHAVICPGHAVYLGGEVLADASWALAPYQGGEPGFYVEHLRSAVELVAADPEAALVLSGGATRAQAGPLSEAESYRNLGDATQWFGHPEVRDRCILEKFACDSLENLQFGIGWFQQYFGECPGHVTVTGWRFKWVRFDFHRAAIGWPGEKFSYCGVNDPEDLLQARAGESRVMELFRKDPLGTGALLQSKREQRNPFGRHHEYALGTIAVAAMDGGAKCSKDFLI